MYASKMLMEALPNIHLLGMFTLLLTLVYRWKALIPIYLYAILLGVTYGFDPLWWPIHLYVWTVLWAIGMLLPRNLPKKAEVILYPLLCALLSVIWLQPLKWPCLYPQVTGRSRCRRKIAGLSSWISKLSLAHTMTAAFSKRALCVYLDM